MTGEMRDHHTLEGVLSEEPRNFSSLLLDWIPKVPLNQYPLSITAQWEGVGDKNRQVARITVASPPNDISRIIADLRQKIVDETEDHPVGILRLKAWQDGKSEDPPVTLRRTLSQPDYLVDGDKVYLRERVKSLERTVEQLTGHITALAGQMAERLVGMSDVVHKLGVTRAAASTSAEVSPVTMLIAAITLPAVLPSINKAMGIRADAPLTDTFKAAQLMTRVMVEKATAEWSGDVQQLPAPPRTLRQLAADPPAEVPAPDAAAPTAAVPSPVVWPDVVELVAHVAVDQVYREQLLAELVNNPVTREMLKERLPFLQAALELA